MVTIHPFFNTNRNCEESFNFYNSPSRGEFPSFNQFKFTMELCAGSGAEPKEA